MNWASGFLPSTYQGVVFRGSGDPILYLPNPPGISKETQRARLDLIRQLNQERLDLTGDSAISSRMHSYELAFRMQAAAPELLDFSKESAPTLEMYGVNKEPTHPYAVNCLLARRMVEAGVRFVMLAHASWDDHQELNKKLKKNCDITDQPAAALIKDLKQRGLLDSTLVVWAGEFGRTPMGQLERIDEDPGRDHHPNCYSVWVAGGGVQGGQSGWPHRRHRAAGRRGQSACPRFTGYAAALPGAGPYAPHVQAHGPRLPADGCRRLGSQKMVS